MTPCPKPVKVVRARKPLKRKGWIKKRPARRIARKSAEDNRYLRWLHAPGRVCVGWAAFGKHFCSGPIQAAHFRDHTGMSLKERDETCVPMCQKLHDAYDGRPSGCKHHFKGWTLEQKKDWHRARQAETHQRYLESR